MLRLMRTFAFLFAVGGSVSVAIAVDAPIGSATIGAVGNPPQAGTVRIDGSWSKCPADSSKAELILYKGNKANPAAATSVGVLSATPAGASGKIGGDMSDATKYKTGDTVFTVLTIYDKGGKAIASSTAGDFTVP